MALIAMAVYDTVENKRTDLTRRTVMNIFERVDLNRHRLFIIDNASCDETRNFLKYAEEQPGVTVIWNDANIGTAEAINLAWKHRQPGEVCIKMDNDVVVHSDNWPDEIEEAFAREPGMGICGLKRKDLLERPDRTDGYASYLHMLPHSPGQRWIIVEIVNHVMGTCQGYNPALLDKIGYLYQPRLYGFDDALAAARARVAGFSSAFLSYINIDHIDPGDSQYTEWKATVAGEDMAEYQRMVNGYFDGSISIYYNPFQDEN
jgi:GT2 family glycosyltransferase